jgi:hypothetical protein
MKEGNSVMLRYFLSNQSCINGMIFFSCSWDMRKLEWHQGGQVCEQANLFFMS